MFFRGGIRIGSSFLNSINFSWPFVKVIFEKECFRIIVSFIQKKEYVILYKNVTKISYKRGLFSKGVIIEHVMPLTPSYIIFWTKQTDYFLQLCRNNNMPINLNFKE